MFLQTIQLKEYFNFFLLIDSTTSAAVTTSTDALQTTGVVDTTPAVLTTTSTASAVTFLPRPLDLNAEFCTCDLTQTVCDINCCCDNDCSDRDRLVFSTCDDQMESSTDNSDLCSYKVKVYENKAVTTETVTNPFIFCIWNERNASRRSHYVPVEVLTKDQYDEYSSRYGKFNYRYQYPTPEAILSTSYYQSGGVLVTLDGLKPGVFYVPSRVTTTSSCVDKSPAKFLQDFSTSCMRNLASNLGTQCTIESSLNAATLKTALQLLVSWLD